MSSAFVWFHHNGARAPEAQKFYLSLLGLGASDGPGGSTLLSASEGPFAALGGGLRFGERDEWVPFVAVEDVDDATKRAVTLGASLLREKTRGPAGDFSVVRDPAGAALALWKKTTSSAQRSRPILEVVTAFVLEKDVARAVQHLAEDVVFRGPLMSLLGRAAYRGLLERFLTAHVETRILAKLAGEDSACTKSELVVRAPTGELLTLPMTEWFQLRGDLIAVHEVFYDPRSFAKAFGLS